MTIALKEESTMNKYIIVLLFTVISGCASRPDNIVASHVPHERYAGSSCERLAIDMDQVKRGLQEASERQNKKADMDAFGVFMFGIPFSQLSGDHQGDVAGFKGKIVAIETAQAMNGCNQSARK